MYCTCTFAATVARAYNETSSSSRLTKNAYKKVPTERLRFNMSTISRARIYLQGEAEVEKQQQQPAHHRHEDDAEAEASEIKSTQVSSGSRHHHPSQKLLQRTPLFRGLTEVNNTSAKSYKRVTIDRLRFNASTISRTQVDLEKESRGQKHHESLRKKNTTRKTRPLIRTRGFTSDVNNVANADDNAGDANPEQGSERSQAFRKKTSSSRKMGSRPPLVSGPIPWMRLE